MKISKFRILLAVLIILGSSLSAMAIEISGLGIKAGANFARLSGPDVDPEWKTRMAVVGGVFLTLKFNDILAIQPEILYSQKGPKWDAPLGGLAFVGTVNLNYLEIPVLVKFYIPTGANSRVHPHIFAGPYFAFKMGAKLTGTWGVESVDRTLDTIKSTDLGYVFGAGIDFAVGSGKITLDVRYGMSFSAIATDSTEKNQTIAAMIGYSFR
jgi:opacity protein-like surface antigen